MPGRNVGDSGHLPQVKLQQALSSGEVGGVRERSEIDRWRGAGYGQE